MTKENEKETKEAKKQRVRSFADVDGWHCLHRNALLERGLRGAVKNVLADFAR